MTQEERPENVTPIGGESVLEAMAEANEKMSAAPQEQIGLEDKFIEDPELEEVLEERESLKAEKKKALKQFNDKHAAAKDRIEKLDLPAGGALRVGRFRLERTNVPGRSVTFDTAETTRINIGAIEG